MSVDIRFAIRSPQGHPAGTVLHDVDVTDEVQGWIDAGVVIVLEEEAVADDDWNDFEVAAHTPDEVLAWVGDDKDKAQAAFDTEVGSLEPREDLVAALESAFALDLHKPSS